MLTSRVVSDLRSFRPLYFAIVALPFFGVSAPLEPLPIVTLIGCEMASYLT